MNDRTDDTQPGFTEESLRMLESREGQLNAVFACFGSAAQHAQLFEQGLTRFLVMYNKIASDTVSVDDIGKKETMGQLIHKVGQYVEISDHSVEEGFSTALAERNFLMHRFFLERNSQLATCAGRMQLLSELVGIEADLERCRVTINAIRIAMCDSLGIEDEWAQDYS